MSTITTALKTADRWTIYNFFKEANIHNHVRIYEKYEGNSGNLYQYIPYCEKVNCVELIRDLPSSCYAQRALAAAVHR